MPMKFDAPQLSANVQQVVTPVENEVHAQIEPVAPVVNAEPMINEPLTVRGSAPLPVKEVDYPEINDKAWDFCNKISRSNLIPESIRSTATADHTAEVYLMMLTGKELGFTFMQTLSALYILPGATQPALYTKAKRALVLRAGGVFEKEDWDQKTLRATVVINRNGQRIERSFGADEAISMRKAFKTPDGTVHGAVTAKGAPTPWAQDFRGMCMTRAIARACDAAYPDVLLGLPSVEDLKDTQTYGEAPVQTVVESNAELPQAEINPAVATAVKPRKKKAAAQKESVQNAEAELEQFSEPKEPPFAY
jgi:hypothetical protein